MMEKFKEIGGPTLGLARERRTKDKQRTAERELLCHIWHKEAQEIIKRYNIDK
jgi:hypothetical protein